MMGPAHGFSGLAAGAALLPVAPLGGVQEQAAWVLAWGGMAMLPDIDSGGWSLKGIKPKGHGSTVSRMWGPITTGLAVVVGKAARGHRNGTHDAALAPFAFGALAAAASLNLWTSLVLLAFVIGAALQLCLRVHPGHARGAVAHQLALSLAGAVYLTNGGGVVDPGVLPGAATHALTFEWLPYAVAGGVLVHIAGDYITTNGVPVPLTWINGQPRRVSLNLFRTGASIETLLAWAFAATAAGLVAWHTGAWAWVAGLVEAAR